MKIDVLTLFPRIFNGPLTESIIKRAVKRGLVKIKIHNLRDFTKDRHRTCDDKPFGGGPGMVMKPDPIFEAVEYVKKLNKVKRPRIILLSPQGRRLNQALLKKFSRRKCLIIICGHYEGVDERVRKYLITDEVSIGDYITTGGELPATVLIDSVIRLIPGVLGNKDSSILESFQNSLLEYPQYTRPAVYRKMKVPAELLSGNHAAIARWRHNEAIKKTKNKRPDLLSKENLL